MVEQFIKKFLLLYCHLVLYNSCCILLPATRGQLAEAAVFM